MPRALVIDNFDSFTWNVAQGLARAGAQPVVVRADHATLESLEALRPDLLVIGPGPGTPEQAELSRAALAWFHGRIPVVGICLGMQVLAVAFGGRVGRSEAPVHGKVSRLHHDGSGLFAGLPDPMEVGRYHSLQVATVPATLQLNAWTEEGVPMGLRHPDGTLAAVQFHPDSFLTPQGDAWFRNAVAGRL